MSNLELVSTSVESVNTLIDSVESERQLKKELIESNVSFPETIEDKSKVIAAMADSLWFEIKTEVKSNTKKDYAFVWKKWSDKKLASISIWKDSNLWRFEITGSNKFARLWYADLNSTTWFSKFNEVSQA